MGWKELCAEGPEGTDSQKAEYEQALAAEKAENRSTACSVKKAFIFFYQYSLHHT